MNVVGMRKMCHRLRCHVTVSVHYLPLVLVRYLVCNMAYLFHFNSAFFHTVLYVLNVLGTANQVRHPALLEQE